MYGEQKFEGVPFLSTFFAGACSRVTIPTYTSTCKYDNIEFSIFEPQEKQAIDTYVVG